MTRSTAPTAHTITPGWQIGITGHEVVPASRLLDNPYNFRIHGELQQQAMTAALDELGWLDDVIVNRRSMRIIDGHLRVALAVAADGPEAPIPVAWCDLDEQHELLALRTINPLAAMAWTDVDQRAALFDDIREADEKDLTFLELLGPLPVPPANEPLPITLPTPDDDDAVDTATRERSASQPRDDKEDAAPKAAPDADDRAEAPATPAALRALASVSVPDPAHPVARGEIWDLGEHVLCVVDVMSEWPLWLPELTRGAGQPGAPVTYFAPYAGPMLPLGVQARRLVMVQPDPYAASHVVDAYAAARGTAAIARRSRTRVRRDARTAVSNEAHARWRRRIVGYDVVPADQLTANPLNWRIHGALQQQAMHAALDQLGWLDEVLVNRRSGYVIDGHLRVALAIRLHGDSAPVPVAYCDLDEREEKLALASFNPLGTLAEEDTAMAERLNAAISAGDSDAQDLLALLDSAAQAEEATDGDPSGLGSTGELTRGAGALLARCDISSGSPRHEVRHGDIWDVGDHVLACVDVIAEWPTWSTLLGSPATARAGRHPTLFAPYPGPFSAMTLRARASRIVMVQPDPYIAGHILDNVVAVKGADMPVPPRRREAAA